MSSPPAKTVAPVLPSLSPAFITADDAARWAHEHIRTLLSDREYGGAILKQGNRYQATMPIAGNEVSFDFRILLATDAAGNLLAPNGYNCEALYHSHPRDEGQVKLHNPNFSDDQAAIFNSFFSPIDLTFIIDNRPLTPTHYLSGADNTLLKYIASGSAKETLLRKRMVGEEPSPPTKDFESFFWAFAEAGELRVLIANRRWGGLRGRVSVGWRINTAVTPVPQDQPFFTPIFDRPELAASAALALSSAAVPYGFVLKHTREE